jgi:hypothetical protein
MSLRVIRPLDSECREREQRNHARAFYCYSELPLMLGAVTRSPAGHDLASFGNEALERPDILVVNCTRLVRTETADLAPSTATPPRTAAAFASAAFAAATFALTIGVGTPATRRTITIAMFASISVSHCLLNPT